MITVQSANGRTFWERHPDHPNGEVFVADDTAVKAAKTVSVEAAIKNGRLRVVEITARKQTKGKK